MVRYSLDIENKAKKQVADLYRSGNKADVKKVEYLDFGPAVSIKKIELFIK